MTQSGESHSCEWRYFASASGVSGEIEKCKECGKFRTLPPPFDGVVTLTEEEKAIVSLFLRECYACRQGINDVEPCECRPWFTGVEKVLEGRLAPIRAILDAWDSWDGSLGPDGRTHPDASSPRDRERLRDALDLSSNATGGA